MSAMVCECSHPQNRHAGDTFGCRGCEYHCGRYAPDITAAESTSAALARVTAERDQLTERLEKARTLHRIEWTRERDECVRLRERLTKVAAERDALKALYADATNRATIVARDGGRDCVACGSEIRRGEAYTWVDIALDEMQHVHCPDTTLREGHR